MKPIVFFSAPRTRSTVLFEALAPFVEKTTGQRRIKGHTELFLEFSRNMLAYDKKLEDWQLKSWRKPSAKGGTRLGKYYRQIAEEAAKKEAAK